MAVKFVTRHGRDALNKSEKLIFRPSMGVTPKLYIGPHCVPSNLLLANCATAKDGGSARNAGCSF